MTVGIIGYTVGVLTTEPNQEYYEIIIELNELGKLAEDMLREAEVKIKAYEDILGDKIRVEIKPIPKREY